MKGDRVTVTTTNEHTPVVWMEARRVGGTVSHRVSRGWVVVEERAASRRGGQGELIREARFAVPFVVAVVRDHVKDAERRRPKET